MNLYQEAVAHVNNGVYNDAAELIKKVLEENKQDDEHYHMLKLYADMLGPIVNKDYITAIDLYQQIINESENDDLYLQAQLAIMNAYLELSMDMMEAYESTRDVIDIEDDSVVDFLNRLDQKREDFLTSKAEIIYKKRM